MTTPVRRGRPRGADADGRVLKAAHELWAERGYDRFAIDEVAARAAVAKTTIYRSRLLPAADRPVHRSAPIVSRGRSATYSPDPVPIVAPVGPDPALLLRLPCPPRCSGRQRKPPREPSLRQAAPVPPRACRVVSPMRGVCGVRWVRAARLRRTRPGQRI
ncbi:helix-turn-helix domain-containing protein [Streptomyces sp. MH60]|uniref:helix-turn-helix domain-containing protein n=1 Tax=Streptomyces sp. MH60 TaxID=1940758 RepID=UPI000CED96CF